MTSMANGGNTSQGARLREARLRHRLTLAQVAEQIGVKPQAVQQWETGKTTPNRDNLLAIASLYGTSPEWLALGLTVSSNTISQIGLEPVRAETVSRGRVVAVLPSIDDLIGFDHETWQGPTVRTRGPVGPNATAFKITTRANTPELNPGDEVVIDPDVTPEPGDLVVAVVGDEDMPILRRYRARGQMVELAPVNTDWETVVAPKEKVQFFGVVMEHTRFRRP